MAEQSPSSQRNFFGEPLQACDRRHATGFRRNGCCEAALEDTGLHLVCAVMTEEFLHFSRGRGNDLSTPRPELQFPGLQPGDHWCLCAQRWMEAHQAGCAPMVLLSATHKEVRQLFPPDVLRRYALDLA